jgi:hypothetical protein
LEPRAPRVPRTRPNRLGLDRRELQTAIDLVASGAARRVVLSGLPFGERLLAEAITVGATAGVHVELLRSAPGSERPAIVVNRARPRRVRKPAPRHLWLASLISLALRRGA